jgi:hypothetical protein
MSPRGRAALVISILSLVVSTTFAFLGWNLNRRALDMKAPKVVATIGRSAQSLRIFEAIVTEARIDASGMQVPLGLKVRNDAERPVQVTSIICWTTSPGTTPPTKRGAPPTRGPDLPHEISTGEAVWEIPMGEGGTPVRLSPLGGRHASGCELRVGSVHGREA